MKFTSSPSPRSRSQAGYFAIVVTMVLVGTSALIVAATLSRSTSNVRVNARNAVYQNCNSAAEAVVEKVLARIMIDYSTYGEAQVLANVDYYEKKLLPNSSENPYWTNFIWSDAQGNDRRIYVARTSTASNATFQALQQQYAGLSGYSSTYRILANCRPASSAYSYNFTNAVQYDLQLAQIPIFQFAIFYNGLLEFSGNFPLIINGPVHGNSNIYVGSADNLTFNSVVTATGNITSPANVGLPTTSWTGTVSYNGSPSPGYLTGQTSLNLPVGTTATSGTNVQQILYPPPAGEDPNSSMGLQRYYNKAEMVILVNNSNFSLTLKASSSDPSPVVFTNVSLAALSYNPPTNYYPFLTVTNLLYDKRESKYMKITQIDVGKLTNWMANNVYVYGASNKFTANNPLNIIYVYDQRTTNGYTNTAVRLYNGVNLPAAGLTVATPNPLYIQGVYNCPNSAYLNTNITTASAPASVACDALTILSSAWSDSSSISSGSSSYGYSIPSAQNDTVNTAVLAGDVPSTGTGSTQYSGGAMNLARLLEDWTGAQLTMNTSLICLFSSTSATTPWQMPGTYYQPPTLRLLSFDLNFTNASKMPPGTPNICRLVRSSWCNPPPNTTTFSNYFSSGQSFVAR